MPHVLLQSHIVWTSGRYCLQEPQPACEGMLLMGYLGSKGFLVLPSSTGGAAETSSFPSSAVMMLWSPVTKCGAHPHGLCKAVFTLPVLSNLS